MTERDDRHERVLRDSDEDYGKTIEQAFSAGVEECETDLRRVHALYVEACRRLAREERSSAGDNVIPLQRRTKGRRPEGESKGGLLGDW